jgi:hypothetical protein
VPLRVKPVLVAVAAAAVLPLSAAAAATSGPRLEAPVAADIGEAGTIRGAVLSARTPLRVRAAHGVWGGTYPTGGGGETVTVLVSDRYPQDQGIAERWAGFLGSLVHGSELSMLTAYLAPPREVREICGLDALACYSPRDETLVAPGEDVAGQSTAEALVTHEYGHHVAANRVNPPWDAVDYGTKRWATHEQICPDARAGRVFPGDQRDLDRYRLNPGEGFAEAYRVLNERKLGVAESPWELISEVFYPDTDALTVLERDVLQPWTRNSTSTQTASFSRRGKARTHTVATALDGTLAVTLRAPSTARLRVELFAAGDRRVGRATVQGASRTVRATICGSRTYEVRVTRVDGRGSYRLTIAKP